jgi:geranylgeranyl reductase family protein
MPVRSCDVLIVGGGPAGSTCARELVRAGLDVVVMDKHAFPRDKVCAGWITPPVVQALHLDCADYAHGRVMQAIHGFRTGMIEAETEVETRYDEPASFGIRRCEFDHYLLQRSQARMRLGEPLKTMARDGGDWLVNGEIRTPLVVGAGGHFCPVARKFGSQPGPAETVVAAQEIEFPLPPRERSAYRVDDETVQFYFCADLKGYGWCFAKGGYLNIGLGREDPHKLPEHVSEFCRWLRRRGVIPGDLPGKFNGHAYLLYPESRRPQATDGALLIGDAAGLAYSRSGEGIRPAVESGLMAAAAIIEAAGDYRRDSLARYASRLTARFGKKSPAENSSSWLPQGIRRSLAASLMATRWFVRHVVVDRWFLHAQQPAIAAGTRYGVQR